MTVSYTGESGHTPAEQHSMTRDGADVYERPSRAEAKQYLDKECLADCALGVEV